MLPIKQEKGSKSQQEMKELLSNSAVLSSLTEVENQLAKTWTQKPISMMTMKEVADHVGKMTKFIARDIGIQATPDAYELTRFTDILKRYYKDLSIDEVKMAFELAVVGELDFYLPKDKEGNPDKNHYQMFSVEFVTKILNAYRKKRNQIHFKALKALPEKSSRLSEEEKQEIVLQIRNSIAEKYIRYRDNKVIPVFYVHVAVFAELRDCGIISDTVFEASKESVEKALRDIIKDQTVRERDKHDAMKYQKDGSIASILRNRAGLFEYDKQIIRIFDELIAQDTDIYEALHLTD